MFIEAMMIRKKVIGFQLKSKQTRKKLCLFCENNKHPTKCLNCAVSSQFQFVNAFRTFWTIGRHVDYEYYQKLMFRKSKKKNSVTLEFNR